MNNSNFEQGAREILKKNGSWQESTDELIEDWQHCIESCETGYQDVYDEYIFDVSVRRDIDAVLQDKQISALPEMDKFRNKVYSLDERMKSLMRSDPIQSPEKFPWWEAYPLRYGGKEISEDYKRIFGIDIEVISKKQSNE